MNYPPSFEGKDNERWVLGRRGGEEGVHVGKEMRCIAGMMEMERVVRISLLFFQTIEPFFGYSGVRVFISEGLLEYKIGLFETFGSFSYISKRIPG